MHNFKMKHVIQNKDLFLHKIKNIFNALYTDNDFFIENNLIRNYNKYGTINKDLIKCDPVNDILLDRFSNFGGYV